MHQHIRTIALVLLLSALFSSRAAAQTAATDTQMSPLASGLSAFQSGDEWSGPLNLSRSGASTNPQLVIDSAGRSHALWEDEIEGFVYAAGGSESWGDPVAVELPFYTRRTFPDLQPASPTPRFIPMLTPDQNGNIHALWIDDLSDEAGILMHSAVPGTAFTQYESWSAPESLDTGAIRPVAAVNAAGLHVAYVRRSDSAERPAGIYYRRFSADGGAWSGERLIYASRYLRGADEASANVSIAADATGAVVLAWDDPAREQVFISRSNDNGANWVAPLEVDRRAAGDPLTSAGPGGITVGIGAGGAVITWRAGHLPPQSCTQYFRSLPEGGSSWSLPQIIPGLADCFTSTEFLSNGDTLYLLGTVEPPDNAAGGARSATYLLAWDGVRWSVPREQEALANFVNPETNQPIDLRCLDAASLTDQLSVVGCDRGVGRDIWLAYRALGDTSDWFPPPAVWQGPVAVAASAAPVSGLGLAADSMGRSHLAWAEQGQRQIFHAYRDEAGWSAVRPVITASTGAIESMVVDGNGARLFMVFRESDGLRFAQAGADRPAEWTTPILLAAEQNEATDPDLLVTRSGELLVAYSVALNEPRGIYLVRSADLGANWEGATQLFSGAAAGWPAVGHADLAETADGRLHAIIAERALPPDNTILRLAYSRSDDRGATWSAAAPVVNAPTRWSSLLGYGERVLHLLWAEPANDRLLLWHAQSPDGGDSWSEGEQIGSVDAADLPVVTMDPTGQLHLLGMEGGRLLAWTFNGAQWSAEEPAVPNLADGGVLDATIDNAGNLIAAYGLAIPGSNPDEATGGLFAMERPLDLPASALPTPPPPPTTATPEPTLAPTATPEPTATIALPTAPDSNLLSGVPGAGSRTGQLAIAVVPAAVVVVIAVIIAMRAIRKGGR
jgi:hypothetical protein